MTEERQMQLDREVLAAIEKLGGKSRHWVQEKRICAELLKYTSEEIDGALFRLMQSETVWLKWRADGKGGTMNVPYYRLAPAGKTKED